jgi:NitT/TauT family transport system ATP-binding protein
MLNLDNVSLTYSSNRGNLTALRDLSMRVGTGEFVAVLGPSGCGKSSLLRIVSGLIPVSSGAAFFENEKIDGPRPDVGIVFQQPTLLPWKNVLDNVLVPIKALGKPLDVYRPKAEALLDLVGLTDFKRHYSHELSGGMQQRVGIARGLVHDPRMLLMDEPFAALDAMSRENMMAELQRIWMNTGTSVLFITHSIQEAVFLADRVITLSGRPGQVIDELKVDLPRPRTQATLSDPQFLKKCAYLRSLFHIA